MKKLILIFSIIALSLTGASAQKQSGKKASSKKSISKEKAALPEVQLDKPAPDTGKVVFAEYDEIYGFYNGLAKVVKNGKCGAITPKGREIIPCLYDNTNTQWFYYSNGLAGVVKNGKVGYLDVKGNLVIDAQFEYAGHFHGGYAIVTKGGKWGIIDKKGTEKIPLMYDEIQETESWDFIPVKLKGKWGYINLHGETVVPFVYTKAGGLTQGAAIVYQDSACSAPQIINKKGEVIVPAGKYTEISNFYSGYACVKAKSEPRAPGDPVKGNSGVIDTAGNVIVPCQFFSTGIPVGAIVPVKISYNKWTYADTKGNILTQEKYSMAYNFTGEYALVKRLDDYYSYLDRQLKEIPQSYNGAWAFQDGMAVVKYGTKYGYVDTTTALRIRTIYDEAGTFSSGMARVKIGDKRFFIDKNGIEVTHLNIKNLPVVQKSTPKDDFDPKANNGAWKLAGTYNLTKLRVNSRDYPKEMYSGDYIEIKALNNSEIILALHKSSSVTGRGGESRFRVKMEGNEGNHKFVLTSPNESNISGTIWEFSKNVYGDLPYIEMSIYLIMDGKTEIEANRKINR
jgi:hypothetical protein